MEEKGEKEKRERERERERERGGREIAGKREKKPEMEVSLLRCHIEIRGLSLSFSLST